jgi:hypothetical protein
MLNKIFTVPRLIFVIVFTYINAYVSAWFAYFHSKPGVLDFLVGVGIALLSLLLGLSIGKWFSKNHSRDFINKLMAHCLANDIEMPKPVKEVIDEYKDIYAEAIGLIAALLFELGWNAVNVSFHL